MDFNPVGGTTAPLLFTWEELGYEVAGNRGGLQEEREERSAEAEVEAAAAAEEPDVSLADAAGAGSVREAGTSSRSSSRPAEYSEQLRRVQELTLAEGVQGQHAEHAEPQADEHGNSCLETGPVACQHEACPLQVQQQEKHGPASEQQAGSGIAARSSSSTGDRRSTSGGCGSSGTGWLGLRVITEAVALRPHKLAYGVPFDFVDDSEGGALDSLLTQAVAGSAGGSEAPPPADLWAELRRQAAAG